MWGRVGVSPGQNPGVNTQQKPSVFFDTKMVKYNRGEKLPMVKVSHVIDPEKVKMLEPLVKKIQLYMDFMLSGKNVKASVKTISEKMIQIDIYRPAGDINAMVHGELYDPNSFTLARVYGANIDYRWGIRILLYFTRQPRDRAIHSRIMELLEKILKLEELYL